MLIAVPAHAGGTLGLPFDPSNFTDPSALISDDIARAIVRGAGIMAAHRPYEPATGKGGVWDFSVEATLVKLPSDVIQKLNSIGLSPGSSLTSVIPLPKLNVHRGLSDVVEIGGSAIAYRGYHSYGGDIKFTIAHPDEGPTWALRFNYTDDQLGFVSAKSYEPEILISREMDFADPYLGAGYEWVRGKINISIDPSLPTITKTSSGRAAVAFMGVAFKIAPVGVKLTLEGSYNSGGADTIGGKFGFNF